MAALLVEDVLEDTPRRVHGHTTLIFGRLVQPLEYRDVGIRPKVVRVDAPVGRAGEHLVVAGIRERHPAGDARDAAFGLIAEDLSALRHRSPEEGKENRAAIASRIAPELPVEHSRIGPDSTVRAVH